MGARVWVLGDIHGDMRAFVTALERADGLLIQVGDFGFSRESLEFLARQRFSYPVLLLDGNHEHHELLPSLMPGLYPLAPNCWYVGRGTVLDLNTVAPEVDSVRVGFMGGACSIDKRIRLRRGWHWSEAEVITDEQVDRLIASGPVDLLITHAPPESLIQQHFDPTDKVRLFGVPIDWVGEGSSLRLDRLWSALGRPPLVCGHMHRSVEGDGYRMLGINELTALEPGVDEGTRAHS